MGVASPGKFMFRVENALVTCFVQSSVNGCMKNIAFIVNDSFVPEGGEGGPENST